MLMFPLKNLAYKGLSFQQYKCTIWGDLKYFQQTKLEICITYGASFIHKK